MERQTLSHVSRLSNVQAPTCFGAAFTSKSSGRGLALELAPPSPKQQPQFLMIFIQAFRLRFALFCCLFPHSRVAFPCFWVGTGGGRMVCSHLHSCVYTSLSGTVWGPNLSSVLCIPSEKCYLISLWALHGRGRMSQGVTIQRGLEGSEEGCQGGRNSAESSV